MALPPLTALRSFEAVARLGSFRAAAESLCVTQSAVSHQIRNVESWLGAPLFERQGNRTRLLPHGAELARRISLAFGEIEVACDHARARGGDDVLVVAAIPSVATCWLIPRLSRFRAAHPGIRIRIIYALHGSDINFRDIHLAFVFSRGEPVFANAQSRFFLSGHCVPVCSPALLQSLGHAPATVADFLRLGLLHDRSSEGWREWLSAIAATGESGDGTPVIEGATFEDFSLLRAAALSGQGVALCPRAMISPDLDTGRLVQVSDRILVEGYDYYVLSALAVEPPSIRRAAQLFLDWTIAEQSPQSAT